MIKSKLRANLKNIEKRTVLTHIKGSFKDPLSYLGIFSAILLIIVSFGVGPAFRSLTNQITCPFLASVSQFLNQPSSHELFISQTGRLESPNLNIIQGNSLLGVSSPENLYAQILGSLSGNTEGALAESESRSNPESKEVIEYVVQGGDTLSKIAEKFGISQNTILWANDLRSKFDLKVGKALIILPVSGVIHYVKKGNTLADIAKTYNADESVIISFNELSDAGNIYIGDILIIPDGTMPSAPAQVSQIASVQIPLASSYFICPISSPCEITQSLHWSNAVDFSHGVCGEPIFAVAAGQVQRIKYGWNGGGGNYLTVLHPNGVVTYYGHLQNILAKQGDTVYQGQIIALMGGQPGISGAGKSTGCHVHFGVQGAKNPFAQ